MDLDWTVGNTTCAIVIMELAMNHNYTKIGQYVATLLTANDLSEILWQRVLWNGIAKESWSKYYINK